MRIPANRSMLAQAGPNLAGFFLVLAFFCGGLRLPWEWLGYGAIFLSWAALSRAPFASGDNQSVLLLFVWLLIGAVFSPEPAGSWAAFARYLLPGLAFFYAAGASEGEKNWLGAVMALGALAAAALLAQRILGRPVTGLIGMNPNYTAAFAAAAFPAAQLAAGSGNTHRRIFFAALALLLAAGLLAAGSRGGLLAAFLSATVALALAGRGRHLALFFAAALAAFIFLPETFLEGFLKLEDARAFARPRLWGAALEAAANSPFFGAGPGLFEHAFELVKFPYFDGISYYGHSTAHAHSEILNLAVEAGFPAALFFAAAFGGALCAGAKRNLPLAACAAAVFIQGSVDIIFHSGAVALLFWGTLGFMAPRSAPGGGLRRPGRAALAMLCFGGLIYAAAADYSGQTKRERPPSHSRAGVPVPPAYNLAVCTHAMLLRPKDAFAAAAAGAAAALAGNYSQAEDNYKKALALEPFFFRARIELAGVYKAQRRRAEGCAELKRLAAGPAAPPVNDYQRMLLAYDPKELERERKDLCLKTRLGAAIAPI